MKLRIEKGVSVHCRNQRGMWSIGRWSSIITERAVEFDEEDVWFAARKSPLYGLHRKAEHEPNDFRERINNTYYMINYYGFHLPPNDRLIDQIVVPSTQVTMIGDLNKKSRISSTKRLERKAKELRDGYSFTGR